MPDPVSILMDEAAGAFDENNLTTPIHDNAYSRYLEVLRMQPDHAAAREGINAIVEQYLSWAISNTDRGNHTKARFYAAKARQLDPAHPNIDPVFTMINDREDAIVSNFTLNRDEVMLRQVGASTLEHIAGFLRPETFVTIRAPDDASGRWLYQELNRRVSFRIQASFEMSTPPAISITR